VRKVIANIPKPRTPKQHTWFNAYNCDKPRPDGKSPFQKFLEKQSADLFRRDLLGIPWSESAGNAVFPNIRGRHIPAMTDARSREVRVTLDKIRRDAPDIAWRIEFGRYGGVEQFYINDVDGQDAQLGWLYDLAPYDYERIRRQIAFGDRRAKHYRITTMSSHSAPTISKATMQSIREMDEYR
jgi:hypothetical protein